MLNICGIVVAIFKMATGRNFSMSGINAGHHYLPTYNIELIHGIEKILPVAIFKMATTIRTNSTLSDFNDISYVGRL
jgi:hypothetical protein